MPVCEQTDWHGCYSRGWKGEIVPEAFQHPAKFARGLIERIHQHMIDEGWLSAGDTVIDPFGGVALGALDAMRHGLNWIGIELEEKFVKLGQQNIDLWNQRYAGKLPKWGSARIIQGDSRNLSEVLAGADCCVSSPPYADAISSKGHALDLSRSPVKHDRTKHHNRSLDELAGSYSGSTSNLGNMKASEAGFQACVSSPPYESGGHHPDQTGAWGGRNQSIPRHLAGYGQSKGQIGQMYHDDFCLAARKVVEQVYVVLKPGGHAVWVVKPYVRKKQLVRFDEQWRQICEAVGFTTLHVHAASLVDDKGTQFATDGNHRRLRKKKMSFFRHLAERKGSPAIDAEYVICQMKP